MSIIPKAKKDLRKLTVLEREKEVKRLRGEEEELIDEMGQDSEVKAAKTVNEYVKEQDKIEKEQKIRDIETLKGLRGKRVLYQRYLILILKRLLAREDIPKKYSLFAESTDKGIVVGIHKTGLMSAFKVIGIPFYDANACAVTAIRIGNTIAVLEGNFRKTKSGIVIAGKREMEIVLKGKPNAGRR